jgi:hypothetical protein
MAGLELRFWDLADFKRAFRNISRQRENGGFHLDGSRSNFAGVTLPKE